ncbi:hypothetical protein [Brevibacterium senegalense]|uniref:hypothetical protein n=1 Tax=Brevibacterium senegalense TaxID=1033736 RepID=UPI0011CADB84|nr:hypothetical protein [Brevibacterium senegalense]
MLERDRRELTAGLLRVLKAASALGHECLSPQAQPSEWVLSMESASFNAARGWDGNLPFVGVRATMARTAEAAHEHGFALFDLARSSRALSVPLATVTRGAIEAYGRVHHLLIADTPAELFARYASIEYFDMDYPDRLDERLLRLPLETDAKHAVDAYRGRLRQWMTAHDLPLKKAGPSVLAIEVLAAIYQDARIVYSGLSATAHGHAWATANFFDFDKNTLRRDDKMLMEYCMYVIETNRLIGTWFIQRFVPPRHAVERWKQVNSHVDNRLSSFITQRMPRETSPPG